MPTTVVLGAQWGDEGKGKIIDALAAEHDIVVRYQGGANAGHTIVIGDQTYPIHLLPSGIFRPGKMNLVGPGVVFDPAVGIEEVKLAQQFGAQILLDESTPIVLPIHRLIDASRERAAGKDSIGTTMRGIGPAYSDFWLRRGLTLGDLHSPDRVRDVLNRASYWNELFAIVSILGGANLDWRALKLPFNPFHVDDTVDWCVEQAASLIPHLGDTRAYVHKALAQQKHVLFEGAQGVLLDTYHGSRPYTTSSLCTAAGVSASYGVYRFDRVIGVAKAYATRVGEGPFPTELNGQKGDELRQRGHEFGTTTGRPRRCGWLDLPALRYACRMGGITELALTKMDVLSGLEELRVCTRYARIDKYATLTNARLRTAKPIWQSMSPIETGINTCKQDDELPTSAQAYVRAIEKAMSRRITILGVGCERDEILWR